MKSCKTCRWCDPGFLGWLTRSYHGAICRNPTVVEAAPRAAEQGWLLIEFLDGGPVWPANPVTGEPAKVRMPCSIARSNQYLGLDGSRPRADANCGPEGRYWTSRV